MKSLQMYIRRFHPRLSFLKRVRLIDMELSYIAIQVMELAEELHEEPIQRKLELIMLPNVLDKKN